MRCLRLSILYSLTRGRLWSQRSGTASQGQRKNGEIPEDDPHSGSNRMQRLANCSTFPFETWLLWQDGGQSRGNTKIASSDPSFINFSTPAAIRWNILLAGEERQELLSHRCCWRFGPNTQRNMWRKTWASLKDGMTRPVLLFTTLTRTRTHLWQQVLEGVAFSELFHYYQPCVKLNIAPGGTASSSQAQRI